VLPIADDVRPFAVKSSTVTVLVLVVIVSTLTVPNAIATPAKRPITPIIARAAISYRALQAKSSCGGNH